MEFVNVTVAAHVHHYLPALIVTWQIVNVNVHQLLPRVPCYPLECIVIRPIMFVSVQLLLKHVQLLKPVIWQTVHVSVGPEVLVLENRLELTVIRQTICVSVLLHYHHAPLQKHVTVPIMLVNVDQVALVLVYQQVHFAIQETMLVSVHHH